MKRNALDFLVIILFLQVAIYATTFFDIPVARQIIGLLYFSFLPGFIIVKLLRMDELRKIETILFSLGLSITFLMLVGLLVNESGNLLGIPRPLSLMPLMIVSNSFILVGGILVYLRNERISLQSSIPQRFSLFALLVVCLPILSVLGAMWANLNGSNLILLIMIIAVSLSFAIGISTNKLLHHKLYSLTVLMISIALLLCSVLISRYLISFGSDITTECFVFQTVLNNQYWSSPPIYTGAIPNRLNSMLSVTVLPTLYSTLLNVDAPQVFKILYPLIFSFIPLALYQLWQKSFGKKRAFAAAFLFMAQAAFYSELVGLARQMIGELFFVLLLLTTVSEEIKPRNRMMFFTIFSVALITSHYALAEIFLFFISCVLISRIALKRSQRDITVGMVFLFLALMFGWYVYTSGSSVFNSFVSYGDHIKNQLGDFLNPASRGETVLIGLGMQQVPSIWNAISRAFAYVTEALLVIGIVGLILKQASIKLKSINLIFSLAAVVLLAAILAVPGLADTLNMTRFYHILLFFLAPFSVLGLEIVFKFVPKIDKGSAILFALLFVLIPYFLFQTGFVYEVAKTESWSLPLSLYRMDSYRLYRQLGYVDDFGVYATNWMHNNVDVSNTRLYSDVASSSLLAAYASVYVTSIIILSNTTSLVTNGTVFLSPLNTIYNTVGTYTYTFGPDQLSILGDMNKVYTNGGGEIYAK
jgi:uncharacterized membrane protein